MKNCICLVLLLFGYALANLDDRNVKKRQIYREQVVPQAGGKIPDAAFHSDRLLLNRLQKEGFAVPDGIILEQRSPQVHPYTAKSNRQVYRVALTTDGRYTPVEGRYLHYNQPSIETTYLLPSIQDHNPLPIPSAIPNYPTYRKLTFPNHLSIDNSKISGPPSKLSYRPKPSLINHSPFGSYKSVAKHYPTGSFSWSHLQQDYVSSRFNPIPFQIFNDFDSIFNGIDFHDFHNVYHSPYSTPYLH